MCNDEESTQAPSYFKQNQQVHRVLNPSGYTGPWTLVCFPRDQIGDESCLNEALEKQGFGLDKVPSLQECRVKDCYELVVRSAFLPSLFESFSETNLASNFDPTEPPEGLKNIHGVLMAGLMTRASFLGNAVEAIKRGWGNGPGECYHDIAVSKGLGSALEKELLEWEAIGSLRFTEKKLKVPTILLSGSVSIQNKKGEYCSRSA